VISGAPCQARNSCRTDGPQNAAPKQDGNAIDGQDNSRAHPASTPTPPATAKEVDVSNDDTLPRIDIIFEPQPWMRDAACKDMPTDWWFPDRGGDYTRAKIICHTCSVRIDCLNYSLTLPTVVGIWGGLSGRERREFKSLKADKPIRHGTNSGYVVHRKRGEEACDECKAAHAAYKEIRKRTVR